MGIEMEMEMVTAVIGDGDGDGDNDGEKVVPYLMSEFPSHMIETEIEFIIGEHFGCHTVLVNGFIINFKTREQWILKANVNTTHTVHQCVRFVCFQWRGDNEVGGRIA